MSVSIEKQSINYPNSVNEKYLEIFKFLKDSLKNNRFLESAVEVNEYLLNSKDFWIISLGNRTSNTMRDVQFKIIGVNSLNAKSIAATYLTTAEKTEIFNNVFFEKESGIIFMNHQVILPPKSILKIYLWGNIPDVFMDQNFYASYENGEGQIQHTITLGGLKAYFAENIYLIITTLFFLFLIIYWRLVKKYSNAIS